MSESAIDGRKGLFPGGGEVGMWEEADGRLGSVNQNGTSSVQNILRECRKKGTKQQFLMTPYWE